MGAEHRRREGQGRGGVDGGGELAAEAHPGDEGGAAAAADGAAVADA